MLVIYATSLGVLQQKTTGKVRFLLTCFHIFGNDQTTSLMGTEYKNDISRIQKGKNKVIIPLLNAA